MLSFKIILFLVSMFSSFYVCSMDKTFYPINNKKEIVDKNTSYYSDELDNESEDEVIHAFRGMSVMSNDAITERSSSELVERSSSGLSNELEFASRKKLKVTGYKKTENKQNVSLSVAAGMYKYCKKRSRIDMMSSDDKSSSCGDLYSLNKKYNDDSCYSGRFAHK